MRAPKLVQHMKANADGMAERLMERIRNSDRCSALSHRVPAEEHKRYALGIYRDLIDWLQGETDSVVEQRYVGLGVQRAHQGVPFSDLLWAVCIAREDLWEYIQQECLLEEPVEFWGGVMLLRSVNQFFDRASYFALVGYLNAGRSELTGVPAAFV